MPTGKKSKSPRQISPCVFSYNPCNELQVEELDAVEEGELVDGPDVPRVHLTSRSTVVAGVLLAMGHSCSTSLKCKDTQ